MKLFAIAGLFALAVILTGCPQTTSHAINRANKQVSDDLAQLESTTEQAYANKEITVDEAKSIASFVVEATGDHKVLTAELRAMPTIDAGNAAQAVAKIQAFVDKLHGFDLHLKSKKAQDAASLFFATFDAATSTLIVTLDGLKAELNSPVQLAGVDLTQEIALALAAFGALAKLLAKWRADGSLTDQQLQDAADAEDDETKKAASGFLKTL